MTADTVVGLLGESAANRPHRPLLRDGAGTTLTVADVAALTAAGTRSERLLFVDEFPLTGLGKVAKAELAQVVSGGSQ